MRLFVLGAAVTLGSLTSMGAISSGGPEDSPGIPFQGPEPVLVRIEIEGDSVRAVPDVVTVRPGQRVEWITEIGSWTVRFTGPNPFPPEAAEAGLQGARNQRNGAAVRADAAAGRYKYMIMVRDGERTRVRDPEIVVDPGDGPGR